MFVVIGVTGVLVNQVPASTAAGIGIYSQTKPLGDDSVNLVVDPNRAGPNSIHLYILDATGRTVDVANGVTLADVVAGQGSRTPSARRRSWPAPATTNSTRTTCPSPGKWTVVVRAQFSKFDESTAIFDVNVNP